MASKEAQKSHDVSTTIPGQRVISAEQVITLAPDAASAKTGEALAAPRKWLSLGRDDRAVWGLLQGSGSQPYQAKVALNDFAASCSCPSRKFPCKHGLGLLFLLAKSPGDLPQVVAPAFVEEWLAKRAEKAVKKSTESKSETSDAANDAKQAAAAAKRDATREQRMLEGLQDLRLWLLDMANEGFTTHNVQKPDVWEQRARRLNDAQLPGLARRVQELGYIASTQTDWLPRVVAGIGDVYLALRAFDGRPDLSIDQQQDLLRYLGAAQRETDIQAESHLGDDWLCLGEAIETDERLTTRRSWVFGKHSQRIALLLTFAVGNQPLAAAPAPKQCYTLTLGFFPSHAPLRAALISGDLIALDKAIRPPGMRIAEALEQIATRIAGDPWTRLFPLCLDARLGYDEQDQWWLVDESGDGLAVEPSRSMYEWMAISSGLPARWFGEWDGRRLRLLTVWPAC